MLVSHTDQISRSFQIFISQIDLTYGHMRVVNKALVRMRSEKSNNEVSIHERNLANHAISRNAEIALQLAYNQFIAYLKSIFREMYNKRPLEIVNKSPSTLQYHEIVKLGNYDAVCDYMVAQVFKNIESKERNTRALLKRILSTTGVTPNETTISTALMYIEIRHLIVHNAGFVDRKFADRFGDLMNLREGQSFKGNVGSMKKALKAIGLLCHEIDQGLTSGGYVDVITAEK